MNAQSTCLPIIQKQTTMRNWLCCLNTKILIVFIYHTIKYMPQNRLIWKFLLIICHASFQMKKITILLFSKTSDISLQILHWSFYYDKKNLDLQPHISSIVLTVYALEILIIALMKVQIKKIGFLLDNWIYHTQIGYQPIKNHDSKVRNDFPF